MQKPPTTAPPSVRHTVRREPGSRATLEVEVDADRLARAADAVFARHVQHAKIPGFRPGKAPRAMYERTYGREHLWEEAAEDLVEDTYREILDAERIEAIDRPEVKIAELAEGKPLKYTATVVVRPEVTLGDYTKHGATVEPVAPADDEVDRTIAAMRESHAQLRPVDRPAEKGDVLTVDIDAKVGERTLSFARNAHIEAGKELGITGLGEALVGMRAGEEKKVELTFPEDTSEGELAGKTGTFSIRPSQVADKVLPRPSALPTSRRSAAPYGTSSRTPRSTRPATRPPTRRWSMPSRRPRSRSPRSSWRTSSSTWSPISRPG